MEIRHFVYFVSTAEELSFTRAAERLGITQPALSHQIRQLEDELGGRVFNRLGRQIQMTELGKGLLPFAREAIRAMERGKDHARAVLNLAGGTFRVGAVQSFNSYLVSPVAAALCKQAPGVRLSISEHPAPKIEQMLIEGDLDLGVGFAPPDNDAVAAEPLFEEPIVGAVDRSRSHLWPPTIALEDLAQRPLALLAPHMFTRRLIDKAFLEAGILCPLVPAIETNTIESLLRVIMGTDVCAILPARVLQAHDKIASIRLTPQPIRLAALLRCRGTWRPPIADEFERLLKEHVRKTSV